MLGSNARGIETEARYDTTTGEFVLSTPNELAQKIYIGNLACTWDACCIICHVASVMYSARRLTCHATVYD